MHYKYKMISIITAFYLICTLTGQSLAAVISFSDLGNTQYKEQILALQAMGYVRGVAESQFAPNGILTASQGVQLIVNALELNLDLIRFFKEPKATDSFPNANNDAWYAEALIIASVHGLDLPSDLDPDQQWTREEFTYYLIHGMEIHKNLPMIKLVPQDIADGDQINSSFSGAVQRALVYNVVQLDKDGRFNPKEKLSRSEAAQMVWQALAYCKEHAVPPIAIEDMPQ